MRIGFLTVSTAVLLSSLLLATGDPGFSKNSAFWRRLGLHRAIGDDQPRVTSTKKKGESTVYFVKLPPQPYFYIPVQYNVQQYDYNIAKQPMKTVPLDFSANGKPESVYHWNLPLGFTQPTTTVPTTTTTTTPSAPTKKPNTFKKAYQNNGKPDKVYFMKHHYLKPMLFI